MGRTFCRIVMMSVLALAGCGDDAGDLLPEARGELGFAIFHWGCTDPTFSCPTGSFPRNIAVGATFHASFSLVDDVPNKVEARALESAAGRFLSSDLGRFQALTPGVVALLAVGDDSVIDYTNLQLLHADRLVVSATDSQLECFEPPCDPVVFPGGAFVLVVNRPVRVEALPFFGTTALAGDLPVSWSSQTPTVLGVQAEAGNRAVLTPSMTGTATITVTAVGVTQTYTFVVMDAPPPPPDDSGDATDTEGSGSGSSAGSDESSTMTDVGSGSSSDASDTSSEGSSTSGTTTGGGT